MDPRGAADPAPANDPPDGRPRSGRSPHFFLSHAPGEDDIYIARLFGDLCSHVRAALGASGAVNVGYLDPGSFERPSWPADAQAALATCHTFVAICSTRYFLSAHCGRSWSVFAGRLRDYHQLTGRAAPALVPVLWSDGARPFLDELGFEPHAGSWQEEARVLSRLRSHRPAYRELVASLAGRIVETAARHRLPPAPPELTVETAPDAFDRHPRRLDRTGDAARVSFTVIAGTRAQMRPIRTNIDTYGTRREDWAPYGPEAPAPVTDRAVAVAAARRFRSELVPLEAVADRIARASQRNEIVVLLVDAWATQLDELRAALRDVNGRTEAAAVLVPTNYADPETAANRSTLRTAVLSAFAGRERRHDLTFHPEIGTPDRFDSDLAVAIAEAENRLMRASPAAPARSGSRPPNRPILGGP